MHCCGQERVGCGNWPDASLNHAPFFAYGASISRDIGDYGGDTGRVGLQAMFQISLDKRIANWKLPNRRTAPCWRVCGWKCT